jgi:hypothetical protein
MAELQPAVLFRYENWIHAVSQAESANEARIDVNVSFNGYRYWTLIFSQRATKGTGSRYQDGFVIGMSGGNNDTQNWIGEVEDLDVKMIRRGSNNFTATNAYVRDVTQYIGHIYYNSYHRYEDLVTYKFVCDTQAKRMYCYMNEAYLGYGPLNFPTTEYSNGRLEVLKTWAQLGDSNCVSYLGDVWLWGCQTLEDAEDYNGGYKPGHKSQGTFLVHHSTHPSGRKMVSDSSHRMYGWKIGDPYEPPVPPDPFVPMPRYVTTTQTTGGTIIAYPTSGYDGDLVTLSHIDTTDYTFNGYSVNGATLYDGNKFNFDGSNVTCSGSWTYVPPPPPPEDPQYIINDSTVRTFTYAGSGSSGQTYKQFSAYVNSKEYLNRYVLFSWTVKYSRKPVEYGYEIENFTFEPVSNYYSTFRTRRDPNLEKRSRQVFGTYDFYAGSGIGVYKWLDFYLDYHKITMICDRQEVNQYSFIETYVDGTLEKTNQIYRGGRSFPTSYDRLNIELWVHGRNPVTLSIKDALIVSSDDLTYLRGIA